MTTTNTKQARLAQVLAEIARLEASMASNPPRVWDGRRSRVTTEVLANGLTITTVGRR